MFTSPFVLITTCILIFSFSKSKWKKRYFPSVARSIKNKVAADENTIVFRLKDRLLTENRSEVLAIILGASDSGSGEFPPGVSVAAPLTLRYFAFTKQGHCLAADVEGLEVWEP